ncbi:MAG: T9SS type A sorting domain-containing protein [Ignavibacteriae bacterium]|nr:T9SS type A sorting domain-containing protein [Ignavibacteriota bacterium]
MRYCFGMSLICAFLIILLTSNQLFSWPNGISGRTKKSNNNGCGTCHSAGTINTAVFSGPDTVYKGQTVIYSLTINKSSTGNGGVDIAALNGLLDTSYTCAYLKIMNSELVHFMPIPISGSISLNFKYIAPNYIGTDTLYATFDIGYMGNWRWAPNRVIHIKQPIGITNNTEPAYYELYQNYPNPFNPYTIISYSLKYNTFVNLDIYNIEGKFITSLVSEYQRTGKYSIPFKVSNYPLSSGVYYYRLATDRTSEVKSMILLK